MEKRYIVSESPRGCLLSLAFSALGTVVGGALSHHLFAGGMDGRVAILLFLALVLLFQIPAVILVWRRKHALQHDFNKD